MKNVILFGLVVLLSGVAVCPAADAPGKVFDQQADAALAAMTKRAEELKIKGAALIAFVPGDQTTGWTSKMVVVGEFVKAPKDPAKGKGSNVLGVAYSKAAEMAATLKDSGNAGRPPMTGELGYKGGLIKKIEGGYLIAAFSGGKSEDDVKVSQAGLDCLSEKLK